VDQEVKEANLSKQSTNKSLIQNKAASSCIRGTLRHGSRQPSRCKKSKMQSWENLGHKVDSKHGKTGKLVFSIHKGDRRNKEVQYLPWHFSSCLPWENVRQVLWKKMPRNYWTKPRGYPARFSSWPQHHRPNFHVQEKFSRNLWNIPKISMHACRPFEKANDWISHEKLWWVLPEYGVDSLLLLAVKSLYSCSEVCVLLAGTDLRSAGPWAILGLEPHAVVTYLVSCLKIVKVCPSYV